MDTLSSQGSKRWQSQSQSSKDSSQNNRKILSPNSAETPTGRSRRHRARKESKHYQVSCRFHSEWITILSCDNVTLKLISFALLNRSLIS